MKFIIIVVLTLATVACSHTPIVPSASYVKISRENPSKDCEEIGSVEGKVIYTTGKVEDAIEDMKLDAARKGANFVRMETTGSQGSSVRGTAYKCP